MEYKVSPKSLHCFEVFVMHDIGECIKADFAETYVDIAILGSAAIFLLSLMRKTAICSLPMSLSKWLMTSSNRE